MWLLKLTNEDEQRTGEGNIQIVQTKPSKLVKLFKGDFLPSKPLGTDVFESLQVYAGSSSWVDATVSSKGSRTTTLRSEQGEFSTWDGKVYFRYLPKEQKEEYYKYGVTTLIEPTR